MKYKHLIFNLSAALMFSVSASNLDAQCTVNCGTGLDGVYHATANTTIIGGTYNFSSFTIDANVVVNVTGSQPLTIYCSGNVLINGGLNANGGVGGNGVTYVTFGVGGLGIGGGANGGNGVYIGSGAPGQSGAGLGAGTGGLGWSGGGGAGFALLGSSSGGGGGFGGPAYGTANLSPIYGGSGGGGGSGGNSCGSGGGGAGGGIISITSCGSITIGVAGQVRTNGGDGGSDGTGNCGSGAGGSGGTIWLSTSGGITNNGAIYALGGVGGATTISGPPYYGTGATGSVGRIRLDYSSLSGLGIYSPSVGYSGSLLGVTNSSINISCFGGSNGSATATVNGGSAPYTYLWSPSGGNAATATGLAAGTYTCTITDNIGCVATTSVTIVAPSAINVSTMQQNVACFGGSNGDAMVMVSGGTGPYTYSWSPSGGSGSMAMNLSAGIYSCIVTDANGCTITQSFTITQPLVLAANITTVQNLCAGQCNASVVANPSGGTAPYTFSNLSNLCGGTYTFLITDSRGCSTSPSVSIVDPSAINVSTMQQNVACFGGSNGDAMVMVSGGTGPYTYSWSPSGGSGSMAMNLSAGIYSCIVTDANGCTITQSFTITQPLVLAANITTVQNLCAGQCNASVVANPSGGTAPYTFSNLSNLCGGTYTFLITDSRGCSTSPSVSIVDPSVLIATSTSVGPSCGNACDGIATAIVTGGTPAYSYLWNPTSSTQASINGLCSGTYFCTVIDSNGCTDSISVVLLNPTPIVVTLAQNISPACFGDCTGAATVMATGGSGPLTWLWTPTGCIAQTCVGLCAGSYSVAVTDSIGCSVTTNVIITEPDALTANSTHTDETLAIANDGTATVIPSGGTAPYTYSWAPTGGTNATATGLDAGTYTCTITDINGCIISVIVTIGTTNGVGIATTNFENLTVTIFPNPAQDHLQLILSTDQKNYLQLEIYNVLGEKVETLDFGKVSAVNFTYNTIALTNGIYFFRVSSGEATTVRKITISH